jgi:hypothetical protein
MAALEQSLPDRHERVNIAVAANGGKQNVWHGKDTGYIKCGRSAKKRHRKRGDTWAEFITTLVRAMKPAHQVIERSGTGRGSPKSTARAE